MYFLHKTFWIDHLYILKYSISIYLTVKTFTRNLFSFRDVHGLLSNENSPGSLDLLMSTSKSLCIIISVP